MTLGALNAQQLRSIVEEKWQSDPTAVAFGLHVSSLLKAPAEVECDFGTAHVRRADTVVQIREALLEAEGNNDRIILLTKLQQGDLGHDVVARMARSRLFPIDHVAGLCGLFKAKELDRSICEPAIAHALLEFSPRDGYPPVSAGVLDAATVWRAVCRHVFEMGDREPDLITLLLWATTGSGPKRYLKASEELQESLRKRLVANLGVTADAILQFVDSDAGPDALALAVTCQVIFGKDSDEVLDASAARLEQYHQNKPISKSIGRVLGNLASEAIADLDRPTEDPRVAQAHLQRADGLLKQVRCELFVYRSDLTLESYKQRLSRFGEQLKATVAKPTDDAIRKSEELQQQLASHRLAKQTRYAEQISRTKMAVRLARWLEQPLPSSPTFADMASGYVKDLAFVDWARESVVRGDDVSELSAAYQLLDSAVAERHSQFSKDFAPGLADWCSSGSKSAKIIGVEDVLEKVVAKVVQANNRVLMIVLDGMSWAVCHELLEDIRQDHWFEAMLDEGSSAPPPVIATVPSETKYSRTSLLSGKLQTGDAATERRCFVEHPVLIQCSDRRNPPVLFHKKDITQGSRGGVSDELSELILSTSQRIVGVVINAIDDRLATAQQIRDDWTINQIIPLGALLRLARDSGRVVVLASDHGHVWHRADTEQEQSSEGSRWRLHDGKCADGEIVISGERVLPAGSNRKVVVPWSEKIRYKRQQHGYHGGATPQEMICPLIILTDKSSAYSGLFPCTYSKPEWWSPAPVAAPVKLEPFTPVVITPKRAPSLFDMLSDETPMPQEPKKVAEKRRGSAWIDRLLSSRAYKVQKDSVRRHAPEDEIVRRCLIALDSQGGIMTPAAFSNGADVRAGSLDGLIAKMQRVLNVDGYEILTFSRNENRVELNITKLLRQFDLEWRMEISNERRREIIAALRKGTVPQRGLDFLAVGLRPFEPVIASELSDVAQGGAMFKAVRGDYGCGKTFFGRWLQESAKKKGFAVAEVQISETETPLHRLETVYRRAMEQLSTTDCFLGAFRSILDGWFYGLEEDVLAEGTIDPADEKALSKRADELLEQRLAEITRATPQFSAALRAYRGAQRANEHATAEGLAGWLAGQPHVASSVKRVAGIKGDVDHFAALSFLRGLLLILKDSGYSGLVLVLDEIETLQRVRGDVREKGLNALRQLIDDIDGGRFPNLYLLTTGTPAFFDGPQGVQRLEPLAQRLHVDFQTDPRFDNPRAVQLRLSAFDHERLLEVGIKVRDLFAADCTSPDRVRRLAPDDYIDLLARSVTGKLGGKVGIAPRLFLKKLVSDVLDRIDQYEDFDPTKHYQLTINSSELTAVERESQAQSVDDIELDP